MQRWTRMLVAGCMGLLIVAAATAALAGRHHCPTCPQCDNKVCVPTPEIIKDKKHCWEIECKDICIPGLRWPWESTCCPPRCGKVKTIKVLKKVEYECEKCGYKWDVKTVGCGCGSCGK